MKRRPENKSKGQKVFRNTYDAGRSRPQPTRGGFRL